MLANLDQVDRLQFRKLLMVLYLLLAHTLVFVVV